VRPRRKFVEERMKKREAYADTFIVQQMEINDKNVGVITSVQPICNEDVFPE